MKNKHTQYMQEYRTNNPDKNKAACSAYYKKNREKILKQKRTKPAGYNSWKMMKQRCTNSNRDDFKYYGGRGISVCDEWASYKKFQGDMGLPPTPKHTIDRIDNDKGYYLKNCRWATRKEQVENRRINEC